MNFLYHVGNVEYFVWVASVDWGSG